MRIPRATYRLQMNSQFRFQQAREVLEYLDELGVSDLYLSPILQASEGSGHGYDVVDHHRLNRDLGEPEDFDKLTQDVQERKMGLLVDIVPNHMSFSSDNPMIIDLLENGPESRYYHFFDVDWNHPYESIKGKLLAPFLGRFLGECLKNGELGIQYDTRGFSVNYYRMRVFLRIESYQLILTHRIHRLRQILGKDHPSYIKMLGILYTIRSLAVMNTDEEMVRTDQIKFVKHALWELYQSSPEVQGHIRENLQLVNDRSGEDSNPEGIRLMSELMADQFFRLSFWKVATQEINYRRFFTINNLISLRVEDEEVFRDSHELLLDLVSRGKIQGFRIDHIDGLYDPEAYLSRLRNMSGGTYTLVEKILEKNENLLPSWQCEGTTGYDFLNFMNGLFVQSSNEKSFDVFYEGLEEDDQKYRDMVLEKKSAIIRQHMSGDIDNLARLLQHVSGKDQIASDYTFWGLKQALQEVMVLFPVYRTYTRRLDLGVSSQDKKIIRQVMTRARNRNPELSYELGFLERVLLLDFADYLSREDRAEWIHFVMKFQQFTGPLMAKGLEDTAFYIYSRFLSLNEVGGDPGHFGVTLDEYHRFLKRRARTSPLTMNASSTHDTKRGEDVRARLNVLSEIPLIWKARVKQWMQLNRGQKTRLERKMYPTKTEEYFIFQTLLGTFPPGREPHKKQKIWQEYQQRIRDYVIKAFREAKINTNWLLPNEAYEEAVLKYVDSLLVAQNNPFLENFREFLGSVIPFGVINSLSQVILKSCSPGIPDFYQGSEYWDLSLVDPDNRRPVDFAERRKSLQQLLGQEKRKGSVLWVELFDNIEKDWGEDPRIKQFLTHRMLRIRKEHYSLLTHGSYEGPKVLGLRKNHLVAFVRKYEGAMLLILVPRFLYKIRAGKQGVWDREFWGDTRLALEPGQELECHNLLTDNRVIWDAERSVQKILENLPLGVFLVQQTNRS